MSMNEHEDLDEIDREGEDSGHEDEQDSDAPPKKNNNLVMAGAIAAVVAVIGFAGFQIYGKFAKPPAAVEQSMMAPPSQMQQGAIQPIMPAGQPQLGQPMAAQPVAAGEPVGAQGQMAVPGGADPALGQGALMPQPAAAPMGMPAGAPAGMQAGLPVTPPSAGVIDMGALNALKLDQQAQSKRIDSVDERLAVIESRLAQIGGARSARAGSGDAAEQPSRKSRAEASKRKAAKKESRAPVSAEDRELARQAWLKKVEARKKAKEAKAEALAAKRAGASGNAALKLPPAADAAKPEVKAETPKSKATINGLRVQAVIPGRVWIQDDSGATRSFAIGDSVKSGVVVTAIDAEKGLVETPVGIIR